MHRNLKCAAGIVLIHGVYLAAGWLFREAGVALNLRWLWWNLFLAFVPVMLALPAVWLSARRGHWGPCSLFLALVWLLFLPNSCYMVTDLIHLRGSQLIGGNGVYLQSLSGWIQLVYIAGGIFLALVDGLFSTALIHQAVKWKKYPLFDGLWLTVISLLCGYGVYIGRFLRLNTWDVLRPRELIPLLLQNIDRFTVLFSVMLAAFFGFALFVFEQVMRTGRNAG